VGDPHTSVRKAAPEEIVCQVPSSLRYLVPVLSNFGRNPCLLALALLVVISENVSVASV
jgi:hypothetical protein